MAFYTAGGLGQLIVQFVGASAAMLWALATGFIMFKAIDLLVGLRVSPEEEIQGLDISEHGVNAYPDFIVARGDGAGVESIGE